MVLGDLDAAKRDAQQLIHECQAQTPQTEVAALLGGVPLTEARKLLAMIQDRQYKSSHAEKQVYRRMFGAAASRSGKHKGAEENKVTDPSNVIKSIRAFCPDDDEDGTKGGCIVLEREKESEAGRQLRLKQEASERHRWEPARRRMEGERIAHEAQQQQQQQSGASGKRPPRHVPCHVSDERNEHAKWQIPEEGDEEGDGDGTPENMEEESRRMTAELHTVIQQGCNMMRARGEAPQARTQVSQVLLNMKDGLKENERQADELLAQVRDKIDAAIRAPNNFTVEMQQQLVYMRRYAKALKRKGEVCMDLAAKIDMFLDPHADMNEVLARIQEDEARDRERHAAAQDDLIRRGKQAEPQQQPQTEQDAELAKINEAVGRFKVRQTCAECMPAHQKTVWVCRLNRSSFVVLTKLR